MEEGKNGGGKIVKEVAGEGWVWEHGKIER